MWNDSSMSTNEFKLSILTIDLFWITTIINQTSQYSPEIYKDQIKDLIGSNKRSISYPEFQIITDTKLKYTNKIKITSSFLRSQWDHSRDHFVHTGDNAAVILILDHNDYQTKLLRDHWGSSRIRRS